MQVGRQILLRCARSLSESTEPGTGGRGRHTGARRRPRRRVGWLEAPRSQPVAIWALVAAAAVVREGGRVLRSVWLAVRYVFRCPGSQICPPFHDLALCRVRERARRRVEVSPKLADVRSNLVFHVCCEFSLDQQHVSTSPGIAICKIHDGVHKNRME